MKTQLKINSHQVIIGLLILLWTYTAGSKLADYHDFKIQLAGQHIFSGRIILIAVMILTSELLAAVLLLIPKARITGLWLSLALMTVFTIYIGLVLFHFFDQVPCSCGGVLKQMGWQLHFWFNIVFMLLAGIGIYLEMKLGSMRNHHHLDDDQDELFK